MNRNPMTLAIVGALLLLAGLLLRLNGGPPAADPASVARCEERMAGQGAELIGRCRDQAFAAAMTATDAQDAASAISTANNDEVGGHMLSLFLIGLGLALAIGGLIGLRKQRRQG